MRVLGEKINFGEIGNIKCRYVKKLSRTNSRTPEPIGTKKEEEENKLAELDLELNIKQETIED